jgi:hypothetical protein
VNTLNKKENPLVKCEVRILKSDKENILAMCKDKKEYPVKFREILKAGLKVYNPTGNGD